MKKGTEENKVSYDHQGDIGANIQRIKTWRIKELKVQMKHFSNYIKVRNCRFIQNPRHF